jgi:hypothetical protein
VRDGTTLFGTEEVSSDYAYAKTALLQLRQLADHGPFAQFDMQDQTQTVTLTAPLDLQERLRATLPAEVRDSNHRYSLCADRIAVSKAIDAARQAKAEDDTWPKLHYLWQQHPIMDSWG